MNTMTYEEAAAQILPGIYRHFKGNYYEVLSIARHSETTEPMVVYRALYGDGGVWVRPACMWNEAVNRDGKTSPRFHLLNREERVMFYERIFDELLAADPDSAQAKMQNQLRILNEYYVSGQWQEDYEADEAGLLPSGLKRGVLSQDGVFDLLEKWQAKEE